MTLVAGNIGAASQQFSNQITADLESRLGRTAQNVTAARVWINGLWFTTAIVSTPVLIGLTLGMGIFTSRIDAGDFPNISTHDGDWMVHRTWRLIDNQSTVITPIQLQPVFGENSSQIAIDNRSMRKILRDTDRLFIVIEKDVVTEETIQLHCDVTVMWLLA